MKRTILLAGALLACTATLFADFSYVETTKLTGASRLLPCSAHLLEQALQ